MRVRQSTRFTNRAVEMPLREALQPGLRQFGDGSQLTVTSSRMVKLTRKVADKTSSSFNNQEENIHFLTLLNDVSYFHHKRF